MKWSDLLLPYRASDDPQGFLGASLMAQDDTLMLLAATWPLVKRRLPPAPAGVVEVDLEDLWDSTMVDFGSWGKITQINILQIIQGFHVLKGNRVIFPDGSLSHQAENLLKKEAAGKFMAGMNLKPGDLK